MMFRFKLNFPFNVLNSMYPAVIISSYSILTTISCSEILCFNFTPFSLFFSPYFSFLEITVLTSSFASLIPCFPSFFPLIGFSLSNHFIAVSILVSRFSTLIRDFSLKMTAGWALWATNGDMEMKKQKVLNSGGRDILGGKGGIVAMILWFRIIWASD